MWTVLLSACNEEQNGLKCHMSILGGLQQTSLLRKDMPCMLMSCKWCRNPGPYRKQAYFGLANASWNDIQKRITDTQTLPMHNLYV